MVNEHVIPSMTDIESSFEKYMAGMHILLEGAKSETAQTPKDVIWTKNKAKLYHYEPTLEKRFPVPILLIYALINRPYVMDLMPGNSIVEYLVKQGFDVYMLDWGTPGDEDKHLTVRTLCIRLYSSRYKEGAQECPGRRVDHLRILHGWHNERDVRVPLSR